jgi:hypothetical protein
MNLPLSKIEELLSGMLDGVLSDQELRELNAAMESDPTLNSRLEELVGIRRSLLSGRQTGFLGADFAKRVTAGAIAEAEKLGAEAPPWLLANKGSKGNSPVPSVQLSGAASYSLRPLYYSIALFTAAVFAIVFFSFPNPEDGTGNRNGIAEIPVEFPEPGTVEPGDRKETEIGPELVEITPEPEAKPESIWLKDAKELLNQMTAEAPTSSSPEETALPNTPESSSENNVVAGPLDPKKLAKFSFCSILDFTLDPVARQNQALEAILEKHGIAFTNDLNLDDDQLKQLQRSGMISSPVEDHEMIGVMFLKGKTGDLNLAIQDIYKQYQDFPEIAWNMSMDPGLNILKDQLSAIQVGGENPNAASFLTQSKVPGKSFPFAAKSRSYAAVDRERLKAPRMLFGEAEKDAIGYVFFQLRAAK